MSGKRATPSPYPPLSPFPFLFPNSPALSFTGDFSPKFHLKNRISTYIKNLKIHGKKKDPISPNSPPPPQNSTWPDFCR
jgi:hypothetical protein